MNLNSMITMKKLLTLGFVLTAAGAYAQSELPTTPSSPSAVAAPKTEAVAPSADTSNRITARLAADFTRVIAEYTQEIVNINDGLRSGKWTAEAAQEKRDSLDGYLSMRLETVESVASAWAEQTAKRFGAAGQFVAEDSSSVGEDDEDGVSLGLKDGKLELNMKRKKWKREFNQSGFYFGYGNWFPTGSSVGGTPYSGSGALDQSFVFNYSVLHANRLFAKKSPLWVRTGFAVNAESFYFRDAVAPFRDRLEGGIAFPVIYEVDVENIRQNYLSYGSFELPVSLVFNGSRKGTKGLTVAAGAFGGVRVGRATHYLRYRDGNRDLHVEQTHGPFALNRFNYGLTAEVGYRGWFVSGRYHLNPVFSGPAGSVPDVQSASLGLKIAI
jgi:hypothetical protein